MVKKYFFTILTASVIMYLSMANAHTFDKVSLIKIPNIDKVVHFCMYFGLMSVAIFENRKTIRNTGHLFSLGIIPMIYGILVEILQSTLTSTRTGSIYDALADGVGILLSILLCIWIKPFKKEIIK